jgi:hypothetical protein
MLLYYLLFSQDITPFDKCPLLHKVERAMARLHRVLHAKAKEHSEALGIDVAPLSGGTPKPPRPE